MNKTAIVILIAASIGLGYALSDVPQVPPAAAEQQPDPPTAQGGEISPPNRVVWVSEAEAKASGKPVLYLATLTKNCAPCKRLKGMLDNPISAEAMSHFACVLIEDPPSNHPWVQHWERHAARSKSDLKFPFIAVERKGSLPYLQVGAPPSVPGLLHFLQQMEDRFSGKPVPQVIPDSTKTSITYPPKPTLAPASHNSVAPTHPKGRLVAGKQERSCVTVFQRGNKCYRRSGGTIFGGCKSCR